MTMFADSSSIAVPVRERPRACKFSFRRAPLRGSAVRVTC
jgi:hypothetical protein